MSHTPQPDFGRAGRIHGRLGTPKATRGALLGGVIVQVGWIEYLAIMFVMSVYAAALTPALRWLAGNGPLPPGESDIGSTLTQYCALLVVAAWILFDVRRVRAILRLLWPYLLIVGLCFASMTWSSYPSITLRRSVTLTVCICYGVYCYDRLGMDGMIRAYVHTAATLAAMSILVFFALPRVGHDSALGYTNALRGVFASKNSAGMAMMLSICGSLYLGSLPGASRMRAVGTMLLTLMALLMTRSATSTMLAATIIGTGSRLWMRRPGLKVLHLSAIGCVLLVVVFSVLFWPDAIVAVSGRDASLTGRVPLWQEALKLVAQRPMLGYGYSAFWNVDSVNVRYLWRVITWNAPNAHNGYIDILLQIGTVGLVMYLAMWMLIIVRAAKHSWRGTLQAAPWMLLFMQVNILLNMDEGPLPYPDEFTLFVGACVVMLAQVRRAAPATLPGRTRAMPVPVPVREALPA